MEKENSIKNVSWFWKWFLNSKTVTSLLVILLTLLVLLVFTKVAHLFNPIIQFLYVVGLPIVMAGVLYYLLNPVVDFFENKGVARLYSIIALFVLVAALIVWGSIVIIPKIQSQTISFFKNMPYYLNMIEKNIEQTFTHPFFTQFNTQIETAGDKILNSLDVIIKNISGNTFSILGSIVSTVTTIILAIMTMPFILFYLLRDGKKLAPYFTKFLPTNFREPTNKVLVEVNEQVSSYIRGQLTVAFAVAIMFIIGFSVIGLDYAITLGICAGFLNLIPYLGSFVAMIPAFFLALVVGPVMIVKLAILFVIEQTIEGRFISPLVLGSQLAIHPITILMVLLTSGKLFGLVGVIFGIPVYAALKVVISHTFEWYKVVSHLYDADLNIENKPE